MGSLSIERRIKEIISEQLGLDEEDFTPDDNFATDLGVDPLDMVELIMALEDEFDLEIDEEDAEEILTVRNLIDYIQRKTQ